MHQLQITKQRHHQQYLIGFFTGADTSIIFRKSIKGRQIVTFEQVVRARHPTIPCLALRTAPRIHAQRQSYPYYSLCKTTVRAMNPSMAVFSQGYSLRRMVT
jgi:hypothetical protein